MRLPGPGAILNLSDDQNNKFVDIWNKVAGMPKEQLQGKRREDLLVAALRKTNLIKPETKPEQVRAYAAKLRKSGHDIQMREVHKLGTHELKIIVAAWHCSATPKDAFQLTIDKGVFKIEGETDGERAESRKENLQKFRSTIATLQKQIPSLKKMGQTRAGRIDSKIFIEVWNDSSSVSEVLKKLIKMNLVSKETEKSSIKAKAKSLNKNATEEGKDPPCKAFEKSSDRVEELLSLLGDASEMARLLGGEEADSDDDDSDDDDSGDDSDEENAEIDEDDAKPEEDDEFAL